MSTMYYTMEPREPIGQTHTLRQLIPGKGKEHYAFTWCMFPLRYARLRNAHALVKDENGTVLSWRAFEDIVDGAFSQYFERRLHYDNHDKGPIIMPT